MDYFKLSLVLIVGLALKVSVAATAETNQTLPGYNYTCGNVAVPYPFGIGDSSRPGRGACSLEPKFSLTCNNESQLRWGDFEVLHIDPQGQWDTLFFVSKLCGQDAKSNAPWLRSSTFPVSSDKNQLITVGCDTYGYLDSVYDGNTYSTGCLTRCYGHYPNIIGSVGECTGIGCCEVKIPPSMTNITIQVYNFRNSTNLVGNCNYSFIAKNDSYKFDEQHLWDLPNETFPLVLDWTVGEDITCKDAEIRDDYACKSNSYCDQNNTYSGYRCRCHDGYEGNPYLNCTDIDECSSKDKPHNCTSPDCCHNTDGSFTCSCPKEGEGLDMVTKVVIGVGAGIVILFVSTTLLYFIHQKRKLVKLKEKYFRQNGGFTLLQQLSAGENSSQAFQIFTAEQLKQATNNFDESLIIGRGGYGTVFKGFLTDNRIVAIKKSKIVQENQNDENQKEQFINEVIVLSQINHRNVVKLLGCCLETEIPLLVYEFVSKGTLFDFIHTENSAWNVTWETRLRIASETAGALSYLHSAASIPIIHRDVKSANILLDDTYTAKVSDFGASRFVPLGQSELATMVQGTIGYLDPEYMQTSQLTEKSDVYSFGVVVVELLTGKKPFCFDGPEDERNLAMHFLSSLREDHLFEVLQFDILDEENKQGIMEVAMLAARCLRLNGEERPTMKEVTMELEGIKLMKNHPWTNADQILEESQYLLHEASSSIYEHGDSSSHQYTGYDSIRDRLPITLDDGR
ncbi:hypothetical protein RJT34_12297 [Clitoria ternatea]|uniref:Uncharacterized protein n=1 Tax=Clitoria ternatea TaxID=43366 RepID=A0AAN9JLW0_CLITE